MSSHVELHSESNSGSEKKKRTWKLRKEKIALLAPCGERASQREDRFYFCCFKRQHLYFVKEIKSKMADDATLVKSNYLQYKAQALQKVQENI